MGEVRCRGDPDQARHPLGPPSATSSMIQPPMLEPDQHHGPVASSSMTASASSHQSPMQPSSNWPAGRAVAAIVEADEGLAAPRAVPLEAEGLGAGHVGAKAGQEQHGRAAAGGRGEGQRSDDPSG